MEETYMKLFSKIKKNKIGYSDSDIIALCDAEMIPVSLVNDTMFAQEMLGQSIAFRCKSKSIIAPCNGILEVMYPTGHAFAIRMNDGTGILVHVGINTVNLKGKGFRVFAKQGEIVKAGQKILEVDYDTIVQNNYDPTTMLIITESNYEGKRLSFIDYGDVVKGQKLNTN